MPREDQSSITIRKSVWEKLKEYYEENEDYYKKRGIRSPSNLVENLILENVPPFEHYNVYEDHATIIDRRTKRWIDVYFRNEKPYCEYCEEFNCEHIRFLLNKEDFKKLLKEKGWTI